MLKFPRDEWACHQAHPLAAGSMLSLYPSHHSALPSPFPVLQQPSWQGETICRFAYTSLLTYHSVQCCLLSNTANTESRAVRLTHLKESQSGWCPAVAESQPSPHILVFWGQRPAAGSSCMDFFQDYWLLPEPTESNQPALHWNTATLESLNQQLTHFSKPQAGVNLNARFGFLEGVCCWQSHTAMWRNITFSTWDWILWPSHSSLIPVIPTISKGSCGISQ